MSKDKNFIQVVIPKKSKYWYINNQDGLQLMVIFILD